LYANGEHPATIGAKFGVSRQAVHYQVKDLVTPTKRTAKGVDPDAILLAYGIHGSGRAAGRKLGISGRTVQLVLAKLEVTLHNRQP
jgi:biotin operon repressor